MKKLMIIIMLTVSLSLCSCSSAGNAPTESPTPAVSEIAVITPTPAATTDIPETTPEPETETPITTPATDELPYTTDAQYIEETQKHVEAMMPILDSVARAIDDDRYAEYMPDNPEYVWSVLYLMSVNWGYTHPNVVANEYGIADIPSDIMMEFAGAAFHSLDELPEFPERDYPSITYDAEKELYRISPSDMGTEGTRLQSISFIDENTITVAIEFYDQAYEDEPAFDAFSFTLVKQPDTENNDDVVYHYSVTDMTRLAVD